MNKQIMLLLSFCVATPAIYGMEQEERRGTPTLPEQPAVTQPINTLTTATLPTGPSTETTQVVEPTRDIPQVPAQQTIPQPESVVTVKNVPVDAQAPIVQPITTTAEAPQIIETARNIPQATEQQIIPQQEPVITVKNVPLDTQAPIVQQPNRIVKAIKSIKSTVGGAIGKITSGARSVYQTAVQAPKKAVINIRTNMPTKEGIKTKTRAFLVRLNNKSKATKELAKNFVIAIWEGFWGHPPVPTKGTTPKSFAEQGYAVAAATAYQAKRTIGFGTIATAIGSAIAYYKFGVTPKIAAIGLGAGALTGLISKFYLGHRANLSEIARRHRAFVLSETNNGTTPEQATKDYNQEFENPDKKRFHTLRTFGVSGWYDMHCMKNEIIANYKIMHPDEDEHKTK